MEILKIMEVSTAHIPQEIAQAIDNGIFARKPAMVRPEGWLFHVPKDLTQPEGLNSRAFDNLLWQAQLAQCSWLLFDRDIPADDSLPTFDW